MRKYFLIIALTAFLGGCATPYHTQYMADNEKQMARIDKESEEHWKEAQKRAIKSDQEERESAIAKAKGWEHYREHLYKYGFLFHEKDSDPMY